MRICYSIATSPTPTHLAGGSRSARVAYLEVVDDDGWDRGGFRLRATSTIIGTARRQAAGPDGCKAAMDAERWLASVGEIEAYEPPDQLVSPSFVIGSNAERSICERSR